MFREVPCTLCQLCSASTDCCTKETIDSFFVERFDEDTIAMNQFPVLWSYMLRELFQYSLYTRQWYLKGSLRKKQLMASFVERLKNIHGNIKKHIF